MKKTSIYLDDKLVNTLDEIIQSRKKIGQKISKNELMIEIMRAGLEAMQGNLNIEQKFFQAQNDLEKAFLQLSRTVEKKLDLTHSHLESSTRKIAVAVNDLIDVVEGQGAE